MPRWHLGRYSEAMDSLNAAIRLKPDFVQALNNLGVVYSEVGHFSDAVEPFKQAIKLGPDDVIARNNEPDKCDSLFECNIVWRTGRSWPPIVFIQFSYCRDQAFISVGL